MIKTLAGTMLTAIGLVIALSTASAQGGINFNAFRNQCSANGGTLDGNGSGATCTVYVIETGLPASHPTQPWTVDVEQEIVSTWLNAARPVQYTEGDIEVIACWNHQGNLVGGFADNPNCQPQ